jgi:drug/metabolite transporter (DMT)-like permease
MIGGIICGFILCVATALQQYAIQYTTAGKAGFITALYIILVPIIGIFLRKKITKLVAVSVMIAMVGLYILCIPTGQWTGFSKADQLLLLSALFYAIHILVIAYYAPKGFPVVISAVQFLVAAILSAIPAFIFEHPAIADIFAGRISVLYAGIMACGVSYTLQVVAQKHVEPTTTSLILSMESVASAIAGWIILNQSMNGREISGAALMLMAMILAQIPSTFFARKKLKL